MIPFLGVPSMWKIYLTSASGILLAFHAAWPTIFKKLQTKPKIVRRKMSKVSSDLRFRDDESNNTLAEEKPNETLGGEV